MTLANQLFDAEMYAAELLVTRQHRVTDKRSPNRITRRTQLLIKLGNDRRRPGTGKGTRPDPRMPEQHRYRINQ